MESLEGISEFGEPLIKCFDVVTGADGVDTLKLSVVVVVIAIKFIVVHHLDKVYCNH